MSEREICWLTRRLMRDALTIEIVEPVTAATLALSLSGSKAQARRIVAQGQLSCDGRVLASQDCLAVGSTVLLTFDRSDRRPYASNGSLTVVYEDEVLLAVDKSTGLLVHSDGTDADTLTARVQGHLLKEGSAAVAQAVQRLDVETTGLTLFSLTREFQPVLDEQVAGHDMAKRYLAVVEGRLLGAEHGWLELVGPIARDRHDAHRMRVGASGKPALTKVRTIEYAHNRSLLLIELGTGRRHQIRVHLAHAGHPILGDALYGGARSADGLMLHAWQEECCHPVTGERLLLRTSWPQRFRTLFPQGQQKACAFG